MPGANLTTTFGTADITNSTHPNFMNTTGMPAQVQPMFNQQPTLFTQQPQFINPLPAYEEDLATECQISQCRVSLAMLRNTLAQFHPTSPDFQMIQNDMAIQTQLMNKLSMKRNLMIKTKRALEPSKDIPIPNNSAPDMKPRDMQTIFKIKADRDDALMSFCNYFRYRPASETDMETALLMVLPHTAQHDWHRLRRATSNFQDALNTLAQMHLIKRSPQQCGLQMINLTWNKDITFRHLMGRWEQLYLERQEATQ